VPTEDRRCAVNKDCGIPDSGVAGMRRFTWAFA